MAVLYDHIAPRLSELDLEIVRAVPQGGNWRNVPASTPSKRIAQIREMSRRRGGVVRTTYYGRLKPNEPSYTISTYFNRPGNGCNIHPNQDRTLTIREAARLQSFPDYVRFRGSEAARRKQVGNAVPVLLARAVGTIFPPGEVVDLFAGAGGLSLGMTLAGHRVIAACDSDEGSLEVHSSIHPHCRHIVGDLQRPEVQAAVSAIAKRPDIVVGGPPCQGWSYAGWHDHNDPRNALVWTFIELLDQIRPKAFIMENVQGFLWMGQGKALESIKSEIGRIGYDVTHYVLNAADFGVPQRRIRVFVVGVEGGTLPLPPKPLFGDDDLFLPPHITVEEAIGDLPPLEARQGADEKSWDPPRDDVPYRDWCRGLMDFEEMYAQIAARHRNLENALAAATESTLA